MKDLLTKTQVAQILNRKPRTVVDLVSRGRLKPRRIERAGLPPVNMYKPEDVAKLREELLAEATHVLPAGALVKPATNGAIAFQSNRSLIPADEPATVAEPAPAWDWLTIEEAVRYRRFNQEFIKAHVRGYPAGPNGKLVYAREDLDALDPRKVLD